MKAGIVKGEGLQFTLSPEVHLEAQKLDLTITSTKTAEELQTLLDLKKKLHEAQVNYDQARENLNTFEGLVETLETKLRLQAIDQKGDNK